MAQQINNSEFSLNHPGSIRNSSSDSLLILKNGRTFKKAEILHLYLDEKLSAAEIAKRKGLHKRIFIPYLKRWEF